MIKISISEELKQILPELELGVIDAQIEISNKYPTLLDEINQKILSIQSNVIINEIAEFQNIKSSREAYKKLGKEPARYRLSAEALTRRIVQGKGIYHINNVVDIINLVSIESHFSIGLYDLETITPPITFRIGKEGEQYQAINRGELNITNLPMFADTTGNFGSPTSDSERTKITGNTKKIVMIIISFGKSPNLETTLHRSKELLVKYANAKDIESQIVK